MKTLMITAALTALCATGAHALEATANSVDQATTTSIQTQLESRDTLLSAAISKINKEQLAILDCMKNNKFYKPADSTADAKGCVGVTVSTVTTNETVNLADVLFNSYPGATKSSKGWSGSHSEVIDLKPYVDDGAKSISVVATLAGFTGADKCGSTVTGSKAMNISNVATSVPTNEFRCHYDDSPNRSSFFYWSYNGSSKKLTVTAKMSQTNSKMTSAKLDAVKVKYAVTKTVLKVGDGK